MKRVPTGFLRPMAESLRTVAIVTIATATFAGGCSASGASAAPETTAAAPATILTSSPPGSASWQPVAVSGLEGGAVLQVVTGPAGLLAVGVDDPAAQDQQARIWTSTDGRTWRVVEVTSGTGLEPDTFAISAAAWGKGWVVTARGGGWTSSDGQSWQSFDLAPGVDWGVSASADRIVAVGYSIAGPGDHRAMAWISSDGSSWTKAPTFEPATEFGNLWGVSPIKDGLLALGWVTDVSVPADAPGDTAPLRGASIPWFSADGLTWQRLYEDTASEPFAQSWVTQVVAGGPGYVAIGHVDTANSSTPQIWTSADGRAWTRAAPQLPFESVRDAALGLGGGSERLVVFVAPTTRHASQLWISSAAPEGARSIVWTSADGLSWQPVASSDSFGGARLIDVMPFGSGLLALADEELTGPACGAGAATDTVCHRATAWTLP